MKILVAGSFKYDFYDEACASALEQLGHDVTRFAWQRYYGTGLVSRIQQRWLIGYGITALNKDLYRLAVKSNPDVVFVTRGVAIWPSTLKAIKEDTGAMLVSNNNDDPFGGDKGSRLWKYFVDSIPLYDLHFVFRAINIPEYQKHGAKSVELLLPYYLPDLHYPIMLSSDDLTRSCDLVFVGHAKSDNRLAYLRALVDGGFNLRIYGWHWNRLAKHESWLSGHYFPPVWGLDYTRVIRAAKIALVFFTERNRDTYTRRSFEIPAIGTCMLSQRTVDMLHMFREDVEASYFSSALELLEKSKMLLENEKLRAEISHRARIRLLELRASVYDRMSQMMASVIAHGAL